MDHYIITLHLCLLVTLFGYFVTLDWMTHHPELHSSTHPQLVHLQKHNNVYTKILLIIMIAEWILCMLFPFWGFSLTLTIILYYSTMTVSRSSHCKRQNCISLIHTWTSPNSCLDCWLKCRLWLTRIFVMAMKQLVTTTAEQPKEKEPLTFFVAPTVVGIILWLEVL